MVNSKFVLLAFATLTVATLHASDTKVKFDDLPAAVQQSVRAETAHAKLIGLAKEVEQGKVSYEIETKLNGRSRDINVDENGKVLSIEEEVALGSVPAPVKTAIERQAEGGKVLKVEKVTAGGTVTYEAEIVVKGKKSELKFAEDGALAK